MLLPLVLATLLGPLPADDGLAEAAAAMGPRLIDLRRDIHQYPELANREFRTGKLVAARLRELGLEVRYPVAKTGVVGVLRGRRPGPAVAIRADMDGLPIAEERDTPYRSRHPGIMHACGHDAHTAVVLAVAELLAHRKETLPGTVVFLFQPAEEGPPQAEEGGAALMVREGALDDPRPVAILGFHVDPTLDAGTVGWTEGTVFASRDHFRIDVHGRIAHSAAPESGLDAIRVAAAVVQAVGDLRFGERHPSVSIGTIRGGEHYNLVADAVKLEGVARALDAAERERLKAALASVTQRVANEQGTTATLTFLGAGTAPTLNDAALAVRLRPGLERIYGPLKVVTVGPQMGSEDFSAFAERVPAFYLRVGVRNEARGITAMTHTPDFDLDEAALPVAAHALARLVWDLLAAPAPRH